MIKITENSLIISNRNRKLEILIAIAHNEKQKLKLSITIARGNTSDKLADTTELSVRDNCEKPKPIDGAQGVKVLAKDLETCLAGLVSYMASWPKNRALQNSGLYVII